MAVEVRFSLSYLIPLLIHELNLPLPADNLIEYKTLAKRLLELK